MNSHRLRNTALLTFLTLASTPCLIAAPGWTMEKFTGINGSWISDLTQSPAYYASPSPTVINSSAIVSNTGDQYGTRIRGYIIPPTTGEYTLWESGDDSVSLFLSPDDNPENKQLIAHHSGFTWPQEWGKYSSQVSRPLPLVAGKKYYIEILHKEALGGDHIAIAWTLPSGIRSLIPLSAMETYSSSITSGTAGLTREFYQNVSEASLSSASSISAFQSQTSSTTIQATGLSSSNIGDSYAVRLRGTITPQTSGQYTFWESGDDEVQLFLSPTESAADKQLIASHTGHTDPLQWERNASQKSRTLTLSAGRSYYIEILHKEGAGYDHSAIAWTLPNGIREILPNNVLNAWQPSAVDLDADSLPDNYELSVGLDPTNRADAFIDSDDDGIPNIYEYRSFSNPNTPNQVTGYFLDEKWLNIPGDKLNRSVYKMVHTRLPDNTDIGNSLQIQNNNIDDFVRRVRGYIVAPATGEYQFWGAADDDMDFFLSRTSSKFESEHLIQNNVMTTGYDLDPSQKSSLVTLVKGQHYFFELWHKDGNAGSHVSVAWKAPNASREIIPSQYIKSFIGDPDDIDDDGLSDSYELANGLSIDDDGRSSGSKDGAYGDLDGDGLTNFEEQKNNTAANLIDSDTDGVSDYDEFHFFGSSTLANNIGAFTPVATLVGSSYTVAKGDWIRFAGKARQDSRRGSVTYPISVPSNGIHALKFKISSIRDGAKNDQHDFHLKLNGHHLDYKTITILPDGTSTLALLTPWLQAGQNYDLEIFVDNSYNWRRVSIDSLQILTAGGIDSNDNSIPDWTEIYINDTNGLDTSGTIYSKTSPAVIEGKAKHFAFLSSNTPSSIAAPNGRFFTEVPLTAVVATELSYSFENQALQQSANIHWLPTNLNTETNIIIRQGDSLLLTAFEDAENASLESYSYTFNGITITNSSDAPMRQIFLIPGTHTVSFTFTNANLLTISKSVAIRVLDKVIVSTPICIVGRPREWSLALPTNVILLADRHLQVTRGTTANSYLLTTTTPLNWPILIKSASGLILGNGQIRSTSVRSGDQTGSTIIAHNTSMQTVRMPVITYGDFTGLEIQNEIIIGGVTYDDGTTLKTILSTQFNPLGEHEFIFLKPPSAPAVCNKYTIMHNGLNIAKYN